MTFAAQKLLKITAASLLIAGLAACGGGGSNPPTTDTTPTPRSALEIATAYLATVDAQVATAVPATGEANAATLDGCFLGGGRTKANAISSYNADLTNSIASNAFRIGSTRINPVVTGERNTTNTDGSARREIDVQYAINYTDGSKDNVVNLTLITGSSFGSCATAQNSPDTRSFGDRQLVNIDLRAETTRTDQFELYPRTITTAPPTTPIPPPGTPGVPVVAGTPATVVTVIAAGTPKTVQTVYARQANFRIQDPMGNATYAVVTGPGFLTVSGVLTPWSLKMLSPRLLKNDSTFANKLGNYTSITDESTFALCRVGSNGGSPGTAALADCAGSGATGTRWGVSMALPVSTGILDAASADVRLAQVGIVAGTYTFAIYNDDGWKTLDGQRGKTPIATYTAQLEGLPPSFVDMNVTGNAANDKFPKISSPSSPAATAAAEIAGLAYTGSLSWTAPTFMATNSFKLSFVEAYTEGSISTTGIVFPRVAKFTDIYPGSNATSGTINVAANPANLGLKTYSELQVNYTNRNGTRIRSIVNLY